MAELASELAQLEEIKKVFAVADADGDGTINSNELGKLMAQLRGEHVPQSEVLHVLEAVDQNGDGYVSLQEFQDAMKGWLSGGGDELAVGGSPRGGGARKRNLDVGSSPSCRKKIHNDISSFFSQFERRDPREFFSDARQERIAKKLDAASEFSNEVLAEYWMTGVRGKVTTADEKLSYLSNCNEALQVGWGRVGQGGAVGGERDREKGRKKEPRVR